MPSTPRPELRETSADADGTYYEIDVPCPHCGAPVTLYVESLYRNRWTDGPTPSVEHECEHCSNRLYDEHAQDAYETLQARGLTT